MINRLIFFSIKCSRMFLFWARETVFSFWALLSCLHYIVVNWTAFTAFEQMCDADVWEHVCMRTFVTRRSYSLSSHECRWRICVLQELWRKQKPFQLITGIIRSDQEGEILDTDHYSASGAINISRGPLTAAAAERRRRDVSVAVTSSSSPAGLRWWTRLWSCEAAAADNPVKGSPPDVYISPASSFTDAHAEHLSEPSLY